MTARQVLDVYEVPVSAKTVWIFLALSDGDGATGWGEATLQGDEPGVRDALADAVAAFAAGGREAVTGRHAGVRGEVVASALEVAALDLEARRAGRPLAALLDGTPPAAVRCYANINRGTLDRSPAGFAARARDAAAAGYGAVKLAPFDGVAPDRAEGRAALVEAGLARVAAVAEAVAGRAAVQVDCHSRFRPDEAAAVVGALCDAGAVWVEEPVAEGPDTLAAIAGLRAVANRRGAVLAGAETFCGVDGFAPFLAAGCYDVVMPDIRFCGGPAEMLRIARTAAAAGVGVSPHNPCGPVMDAASRALAPVCAGVHSLERQVAEDPLYDRVQRAPAVLDGDVWAPSDAPGTGFTPDPAAMAGYRVRSIPWPGGGGRE